MSSKEKSSEQKSSKHQLCDYVTAFYCFKDAADEGHAESCYSVGIMYTTGFGTTRDYNEAAFYYKRAIKINKHFSAACRLQVLERKLLKLQILYGEAMAAYRLNDYVTAFYCFKEAADEGHAESCYSVGMMYTTGVGTARDHKEAVFYYKRAIEINNHFNAACRLQVLERHMVQNKIEIKMGISPIEKI